jgi:hypothetical protein
MSAINLTAHAVSRMSQRGMGLDDIALVEQYGIEVEGGYLVRRKDAQAFERDAKRKIDQLWRLVGKRVVRDGNVLITVYHANPHEERRLLRSAAKR